MTAMYCLQTHVYQAAGQPALLTIEGANRDSTHPAVVANAALFSATAPVVGTGHISPALFQYLAAHKAGPEL